MKSSAALARLSADAKGAQDEIRYTVLGRPVSWQRPNIVRGRIVTPSSQRDAKKAHAYAAIAVMRASGVEWSLAGKFEVDVIAYYPNRVQGDTDRLLGIPLDAMQGIAYDDDRQVIRVTGERRIDKSNPRIEVVIRRVSQ